MTAACSIKERNLDSIRRGAKGRRAAGGAIGRFSRQVSPVAGQRRNEHVNVSGAIVATDGDGKNLGGR